MFVPLHATHGTTVKTVINYTNRRYKPGSGKFVERYGITFIVISSTPINQMFSSMY